MNRLLISCALLVVSVAEVAAAEYICKLPGGKTSIQGTPCSTDAKTAYQNTSRYESREDAQARIQDADERINGPARREAAERTAIAKQQQEEEEKQAKIAREQALINEMRRTRRAAEAAAAANEGPLFPLPGATTNQPAPQPNRGMNCFQYGQFMDCKPR